ncbi:molybdate ABC transporter substrate-binding protein [Sinimarinibacterium flocculans]|uniref:Molybdate transport system substrate-binding protein n=1 Tax=Sinimarinibacterium flocculans TaxID=985250 RepID=A0A318E905_9GAMM|nr:molybdate ABC transporter substrate-binding protein [Sinimarinibacterium flocculans]PXV65726.1 molybdate transport system substrate-binding protein [Sinimarinibacterium flocculans]
MFQKLGFRPAAFILLLLLAGTTQAQERLLIATAANLKPAMDVLVTEFRAQHPDAGVEPVYGASGALQTQIRQGAPFDLFFSADTDFPRQLAEDGHAGSTPKIYARGRIVLWSATVDASALSVQDLARPEFQRIAIANPRHAPYGMRAEEALRASGIWDAIEDRMVYGESIAQTAQFVESGSAQIGIIALAQALVPQLADKGGYALIPETLHEPLDQGFIVTRRAADNALAHRFAAYIGSPAAHAVFERYGYTLPEAETVETLLEAEAVE